MGGPEVPAPVKEEPRQLEKQFVNALIALRGAYTTALYDEQMLWYAIGILEELSLKHSHQDAEAILREAHSYLVRQM
jgi:hypothetical protein